MGKTVDTKEYLDMVCGLLAEGKTHVPVPVAGVSMTPFLHPGDIVWLDLLEAPPKKADIVLFTRPDGQYVLHRIVAVNPDGSYVIVGDAQVVKERVFPDQIRAVITSASCRGRKVTPGSFRWRFFATVWMWSWIIPLRQYILLAAGKLKNKTH